MSLSTFGRENFYNNTSIVKLRTTKSKGRETSQDDGSVVADEARIIMPPDNFSNRSGGASDLSPSIVPSHVLLPQGAEKFTRFHKYRHEILDNISQEDIRLVYNFDRKQLGSGAYGTVRTARKIGTET